MDRLTLGSRKGQYRGNTKIWVYPKLNITTEEINNKLLLATENEGGTVWKYAAMCENLKTLQKCWNYAK